MSDDKNVWKQFMDFQMRKNEGDSSNDANNTNNNNGTRAASSASCELIHNQQQRENQNGVSSGTNTAGAVSSNSRERLKDAFSDDAYGRLFHGPDWERQSMELLQQSYSNDNSGIGRMTNGASSDVPSSSTSSSHVHLKSAQSSTENLIGGGSVGDCDPTYYFDGYENCGHDGQHHHQDNGSGRCAGSSNHCSRQPLGTSFPHATMKLSMDSESDEDSLDLYLEYYRQSGGAKDQQSPLNMSQASPRGQAQNSLLEEDIAVPSTLQQQQTGSSSGGAEGHGGLKMGILEMLEQLQALTRTRATAAAAAATRQDGPSKSAFSTMHNAMPFQSPVVPHASLGIYTTNENNLIVAQQYAEWEKEMELAEDSGFSMDFYFESGDMDGTLARSDMATSSRDLDSLALEGSRLNAEINQRRAASRFGLNSSLGQHRCDYSSLCPGAECTSADYNLIRVADNPRGFTPRSYFAAAGGDNVESTSIPNQANGSRKSSREIVETHEAEENREGSHDAAEIPEECIYDVEERADACDLEQETPVDSAEVPAGCDDTDGNCESSGCASLNPFEDLPIPPPLETAVSPRPRQLGHGDNNNLVTADKKLIAKVAGIKAGFKHFRRRISSCFFAQGE